MLTPSSLAQNCGCWPPNVYCYNRAVAFGEDKRYLYAWGGGSGSVKCDELWRYDFKNNSWSLGPHMPTAAHFGGRTSANYGNKLIAADGEHGDTYEYDVDAGLWTDHGRPHDFWGHPLVGCVHQNYYYIISGGGDKRCYRLDLDNPVAWEELTPPPAPFNYTQYGAAIPCPIETDRIVVFERDDGGVHYYSVSGDSWVDLGDICPSVIYDGLGPGYIYPWIVFSTATGIIAGWRRGTDPNMYIDLYRLDWTGPSFVLEQTWGPEDYHGHLTYYSTPRAATNGQRLAFGSGYTWLAAPPVAAPDWWGGELAVVGMAGLNPALEEIMAGVI